MFLFIVRVCMYMCFWFMSFLLVSMHSVNGGGGEPKKEKNDRTEPRFFVRSIAERTKMQLLYACGIVIFYMSCAVGMNCTPSID